MNIGETVSGQRRAWTFVKKIGEGDAGEVFLVESLLEKQTAILKRPQRSSFSSDSLRQAAQIEAEGKILQALETFCLSSNRAANRTGLSINTPRLLDQSQPGAEFSERFFIVLEKARGIDLITIARAIHSGQVHADETYPALSDQERLFINLISKKRELPALMILRSIYSLIEFIDRVHAYRTNINGGEKYGILWNDVKPEHLYWEPDQRRLTLIDWGNGQFLESDGATRDRRYSGVEDYSQFVTSIGKYLADYAPELRARLGWPERLDPTHLERILSNLKKKIVLLLQEETDGLFEVRKRETTLLQIAAPSVEQFNHLKRIQDRILDYGELPDFATGERFCLRLAAGLASADEMDKFTFLCQEIAGLPQIDVEKWSFFSRFAESTAQASETSQPILKRSLIASLDGDWPAVLWGLKLACPDGSGMADFADQVRGFQPEIGAYALTPFIAVNRLAHTLQADVQKLEDLRFRNEPDAGSLEEVERRNQLYKKVITALNQEVLAHWTQAEPDPPYTGLGYQDLERLIDDIGELLPDARQDLLNILDQPKAQVEIVLEAWRIKDLDTARRGLRRVLLWDPDRRRVFQAEKEILATPAWLAKVQQGPARGEPLLEFVTHVELNGRELRNRIGPARWLDLLLEALMQLRKGARPAEILMDHPELLNEMPWLDAYTPRKPPPSHSARPVFLERLPSVTPSQRYLKGKREGRLGQDQELTLADPLDTWAAEVKGSSARVFTALLRETTGQARECALKLARCERLDYALPLFREEARILPLVQAVPGVTRLLECGFIQFDPDGSLPPEDKDDSAGYLTGSVLRYGIDEVNTFLASLELKAHQGWVPYLALEKRDNSENLMRLCDAGITHGRFLPVKESLRFAIQICDILQAAHDRNIVYRDHKIVHYYWQEKSNNVYVIDWNVAKLIPQGLSNAEKQFDLVQLSARGLHHILTGRPAPGSLPVGPTSPAEIEAAARSYQVAWTFDDERLSRGLRAILEKALAGEYINVADLREDLLESFIHLPETGY